MRRVLTGLLVSILLSCSPDEREIVVATSEIVGYDFGDGTNTIGSFRATYSQGITTVTIQLRDQTNGAIHSVHIYEGTCESPGDVWNLGTEDNYCQVSSLDQSWFKSKAGDIGNVLIGSDGTGSLQISTDLWSVGTGRNDDILGKVVIVHFGPEDFLTECDPDHILDHTHPTTKMGCGEISAL